MKGGCNGRHQEEEERRGENIRKMQMRMHHSVHACMHHHQPYSPTPSHPRSRNLIRHAGHGARGVILAPGPQAAADLRGFAKGHADARGAEEGVGGAVVFAEVKVYVGAWVVRDVSFGFGLGSGRS